MAFLTGNAPEIIGLATATVLTLAVLSYLFGDNGFFRLAQSLFVGVSAGYIGALCWHSILWPRILLFLHQPAVYWHYGLFFILGILLLARGLRATRVLADLPVGILFGIGAALALGGTLAGTLLPLVRSLSTPMPPQAYGADWPAWVMIVDAILIIIGTLAVLGSFQFTIPQRGPFKDIGKAWSALGRSLGRGLIMVTFGALYAGALVSFFTLLIGRIEFLLHVAPSLLRLIGL
ncbi:MAG: hypothetical protein ACYCZF_17570 [Anaerolineae bacterium]